MPTGLGHLGASCQLGITTFVASNLATCPTSLSLPCTHIFASALELLCDPAPFKAACPSAPFDDVLLVACDSDISNCTAAVWVDTDGNVGVSGVGSGLQLGTESQSPTHSPDTHSEKTATRSESTTQSMTPSRAQSESPTETAANPGSIGDPILIDFSSTVACHAESGSNPLG